jgi:hypothetical protein
LGITAYTWALKFFRKLQLDFRLFCSLSWSVFSALPAFILFFIIFFLEKKRILGNHPKLGDDKLYHPNPKIAFFLNIS